MTSKERVITAINHKEPDKIPFDLGGSIITGIHYKALKRLMNYYWGDKIIDFPIVERLGVAVIPEEVLQKLEVDVRNISPVEGEKKRSEDDYYYYYIDEWGVCWRKPKENGYYYDVYKPYFNDDFTQETIDQFSWPDINDEKRYQGLDERIGKYANQYALVMEGMLGGEILDGSFWMRGYENLFCDMILNEKEFLFLLDKKLEIQIAYWKKIAEKYSGKIDIVRIGDDLGEQSTTRTSPEMYRRLIKPYHKKLIESIRESLGKEVYIFFHSDGCIYDLIPDLIEIGVNILNPIQYTIEKMNSLVLKKEFGNDLTFWGGGIDTQNILPFGSPESIENEVRQQIDILSKGGGFVFAAVHNIQHDVPLENMLALFKALSKYR